MNYLRYLSPKSPFSERELAIASLKSLMLFFLFMYMFLSLLRRPKRDMNYLRYLSPPNGGGRQSAQYQHFKLPLFRILAE